MRFFNDGRVLYTLCTTGPKDIAHDMNANKVNAPGKRVCLLRNAYRVSVIQLLLVFLFVVLCVGYLVGTALLWVLHIAS